MCVTVCVFCCNGMQNFTGKQKPNNAPQVEQHIYIYIGHTHLKQGIFTECLCNYMSAKLSLSITLLLQVHLCKWPLDYMIN